MFQPFRVSIAAIHSLTDVLRGVSAQLAELCAIQKEMGPARERLEQLELGRHTFEAQMEGLVLKAEGKFRSANNAEARERQLKRSYENLTDPFVEDGDRAEAPVGDPDSGDHAAPGKAEGLPPVRLVVAPSNKARAQQAKWGR